MSKLMDVSDADVAVIEEVIAERLALGVSQAQAQRQAVDEALAQLADERSMVMKAIDEQLGFPQKEAEVEVSEESRGSQDEPAVEPEEEPELTFSNKAKADAERAGFDSSTVWLHGTTRKFTGFKVGKGGVNELGPGVYFTKDPMYADAWSGGGRVEGGQTIPAVIKKGDIFDKSQKVDYIALAQRLKELNPVTDAERQAKEIRATKSALDWTPEESKIINDASQDLWRSWLLESDEDLAAQIKRGELNNWLDRAGYIGAKNKNSQVPDQIVVFDPKNIRSPWAKFNEKKADSPNLLFSNKSSVLSKDGSFNSWPQYNKWTRAEYNDVVSLLPAEYRDDSHRREPIAPSDWNALSAAVLSDIDELNAGNSKSAFGLDSLGNIVADQRDGLSTNDLIRAAGVADKHDLGVFVTGVRTNSMQLLTNAGFVSELGLGAVLQRATGSNQPPRPMATGGYNNPAYGTMMSYQPRGFAEPMFANKPRPAPLAEETQFQKMRRIWQDQYVHVEAIQNVILKGGGTVGEQQNVYRAEERMHGRAQEKLIDFGRDLLEPLLKKATKYGVELNELAAYAYAKHAEERNDHIDTINPNLQGAGSGMDNATAANIIQMVQLSGDQAKFDELQQDLMKLTEATRQEYLKSGLISQADYDAWTDTYKNYVPLRGFENVDPEGNARPGAGSGLSVKGKETMKALGRRSRAADIIENIVAEHERAVLRGERNIVAKTFLNLAQTNPDPALWEVQPRKVTRSFDKTRNLVVYSKAPDTADSVGAKVGGQQIYVKVKDPLLLQALTNSGRDKKGAMHGTVVEYAGLYTNLLRNTLTRYNPVFGAVNAVRDAPMGALAAYDALGAKGVALYAKYYPAAALASGKHEWSKSAPTTDMDRWLKEMRLAGGTTSGVFMRDVSEIRGELRTLMLLAGAAPTGLREKLLVRSAPAVKGAKAVGKVLEWMGATSEDAGRLAAYRAARELGKTPAEAASIAKNLTTNFNRSGEWGPSMNGLYMFFNAGVQGTTKLAQMLANKNVRYVLAAGTAATMALALANAAGGGDDDDGVPYWDLIPEYEKERNLIIMMPPGMEMDGAEKVGRKGRYIKIPVQYGLNIFTNLGYQLAGITRNLKDPARGASPAKAGMNMVSSVFGSINPFGGSVDLTDPIQVGMALSPTLVDTAIQQMAGVNGFGRPVGPAKSQYDTKPDSETYSANQAGGASQRLAEWMNSVSGGNQFRPGQIDVMPGTLDNAVRNVAGGTGTFFMDVMVNLPTKYWNAPEVVAPRDVPFWRNAYADLDGNTAVSRSYENRARVSKEAAIAEKEKGLDVKYTPEQEALQSLDNSAQKYTKQMSKLRKQEIEVAIDADSTTKQKLLARRALAIERANLAKEFNADFISTMDEAARKKD